MVFVVIAVLVLVALALWVILAVGSKGTEEGDKLVEKWYEDDKRTDILIQIKNKV